MYATTLHLAPCSAHPEGFKTIVVLPKGTNYPLSPELKAQVQAAQGEHRLLNATDNWAITFPDTDSAKFGIYPGMQGVNRRCAGYEEEEA